MKRKFIIPLLVLGISIGACQKPDDGPENKTQTPESGSQNPGGSETTPTYTIDIPSSEDTNPVLGIEGGNVVLNFRTSAEWTANVINTRADSWVDVSPKSGNTGDSQITISVAQNDTYDERSATVQIKCGSAEKNIVVTQKQKDALTVTKSRFDIPAEGGEVTIEVNSNISYDYAIDAEGAKWIKEAQTRALSTTTLQFVIAENTEVEKREGSITISSGDLEETINVYQEGAEPVLVLSQNEYTVKAEGETIQVDVKSNVNVSATIQSGTTWISEISTRAMSTNTFFFSIDKNEDLDPRSAEITFVNVDNGLREKISIMQLQKGAIAIAKNLYEFDRSGGELTVEVNHSVEFDVEISDGWISEVSTKAMSTTAMIFSIANNDSGKKREGHITFKSKDESISQCITVKQGIITTIVTSKKSLIFYPEGGSEKIEINPLVKFTYDIDEGSGPNWIQSSSIQEPTINLKIGTNDSSDERLGYVYVTDIESGKVDTVKIVQRAFDVYIIEDEYSCSYKGGSLTIDFQTNVPYSVELKDSPDWISIVSTKALSPSVISFNCNKNTSTSSRIAIVQFFNSYGECTKEIAIRQYSSHYEGDYIVDSEEDALFLNKCAFTAIDGDLTIKDIPSAASMNNIIEEISGSLYLYCQYPQGMSNFDGLYGLKHVVGDVIIQGDPWKLMSTEGLNNLNKIDGSLNIHGQYDKNAFKGLIGLTSIGGNLTISASSSDRITVPFTGLNNLLSVGGDISISNADDLTGLELTKVNNLTLSNVNSFTGLSRLHEISGNLEITGDSTADSFAGFDNLEIIGGNFYISARADRGNVFSNISSFSGFSKLRQIGGNFEIYSYVYTDGSVFPNLTSLDGFESLTKVNGNFLLHSRMQERNKDNGGIGKIYIFPKLLEINIPTLQEIGGNLEITNTTMAAQYRNGGKYCYGIDYKNVTFNNLQKIGGNFVCSDIAEDSYWSGNNAYKLCKAPPKLECLAGLSANMAFSSINDGFLSLTEIDNLTLTEENCLGFPAIETINKGLNITLFDDPGEEFKMDKLKIIGGDLSIYLSRYNHNELSIMQSLETIGGSFNLELSTMQDQFVNKITGFTNLSSVKSISVRNFTKVDDFRVFVNAVKNGSSWICSGCAFNPTQTQMRNGIYKED